MTTFWLHAQVVETLGRDGASALDALIENVGRDPLDPPRGPLERVLGGFRFQLEGLLRDTVGVFEAQPASGPSANQDGSPGRRALLLPSGVIDDLGAGLWENACARFGDISNIDVARQALLLELLRLEELRDRELDLARRNPEVLRDRPSTPSPGCAFT